MSLVVRAYPVLPGMKDRVLEFGRELMNRRGDTDGFYRAYGVRRETWHLQDTPAGTLLIVASEVGDPTEAAKTYASARQDFHAYFKSRVLELSGVDPNREPLGPPCECVFDWNDKGAATAV
jgi:hypothetical protein